jgi:hypothetical protein
MGGFNGRQVGGRHHPAIKDEGTRTHPESGLKIGHHRLDRAHIRGIAGPDLPIDWSPVAVMRRPMTIGVRSGR